MNHYSDETGFIETLHTRLIDDLLHGDKHVIELAIVSGVILGEYLVKESLRRENSLLPYNLSSLGSAHDMLAMIVKMGPEDAEGARYEDLGVLLQRAKSLSALPLDLINIIGRLKDERNRIVHDPRHEVDNLTSHSMLIYLLVDHRDLIKSVLGLDLPKDKQDEFKIKAPIIAKQLSNRLDHKIKAARELYGEFSKVEKSELKNAELNLVQDQFLMIDKPMRCPACYNKTLYYTGVVDVDYDGPTASMWFECPACELEMSEYDFDELNTHPEKYTNLDHDGDESWSEYYDFVHMQENAYEYM